MVKEHDFWGIRAVTLSNDRMEVQILAGKGGDIYQIRILPDNITFLYNQKENLIYYRNRNLYKDRLSFYSENNLGGWQDVIPGFGKYGDKIIAEAPLGLAATIGWNVEWNREDANPMEVVLDADIPVFPLHITKRIGLTETGLYIVEHVFNKGDKKVEVTWTQHAVFGGSFLGENVRINYPGEKILLSSIYAKQGGNIKEFEKDIKEVPMPDGTKYDLTHMRSHIKDGQLVFTMKADQGYYSLIHEKKKIELRIKWDLEMFPYLRCWYQNIPEAYALALEPCNYYYSTFAETDKDDMYLHLEPKEEVKTEILLDIIKGEG